MTRDTITEIGRTLAEAQESLVACYSESGSQSQPGAASAPALHWHGRSEHQRLVATMNKLCTLWLASGWATDYRDSAVMTRMRELLAPYIKDEQASMASTADSAAAALSRFNPQPIRRHAEVFASYLGAGDDRTPPSDLPWTRAEWIAVLWAFGEIVAGDMERREAVAMRGWQDAVNLGGVSRPLIVRREQVEHIDGDLTNNKLANLRIVEVPEEKAKP